MGNQNAKPYITLAQSRVSPGHFRPVGVDAAGRVNNLNVHTHRHTIKDMAAVCKLYALKYNIRVLFQKYIATLPVPEPLAEELNALVLAEVAEVLQPDSQEEFDAGYEAMQEGVPYNSAQTSGWKNGWVEASKRYGGVSR